jgi:hypothetical protein
VAIAENAVQTARYPKMKMATGTNGRSVACRRWFTVRKARIIGAADGTIMATIITAHIANLRPNSVAVHGCTPVTASIIGAIGRPLMSADSVAIRRAVTTMYTQAATVMPPRPANTAGRSRWRQTPDVVNG